MDAEEKIMLFGLSLPSLERQLDKLEIALRVDFQRVESNEVGEKDEQYYPQFDQALRQEAADMSRQYELFYCLEKSIRKLVAEALETQYGENWWDTKVPQAIRENAKANIQKEIDSGVTSRSELEIDFTTFGELGEIVRNNWDSFDAIFSSQKAFTKIMTNLNMLRGPIAHCCPLAEDEILRLKLTLRDWFRLME